MFDQWRPINDPPPCRWRVEQSGLGGVDRAEGSFAASWADVIGKILGLPIGRKDDNSPVIPQQARRVPSGAVQLCEGSPAEVRARPAWPAGSFEISQPPLQMRMPCRPNQHRAGDREIMVCPAGQPSTVPLSRYSGSSDWRVAHRPAEPRIGGHPNRIRLQFSMK